MNVEIKKFKQKWDKIRTVEEREFSKLTVKEKFQLLVNLMRLTKGFKINLNEKRLEYTLQSNWSRLKRIIS